MNLTFDDGYQFGLGAFETLSLIAGRPVWLEAHEARLRRTLGWLGLSLPADWKERLKSYLTKEGNDKGVLKILASVHVPSQSLRSHGVPSGIRPGPVEYPAQ